LRPVRLLAIAGSDSGGGAGIQADIRTACAFGVYAMTAVTVVTAQDTTGVGAIALVRPEVVREQIARCLTDIGADAIKIGMLGSAEIAEIVAATLDDYAADVPRVVDPVLVSTSGATLSGEDVAAVLKGKLFPGAAVVTPNLPEAEALCGFPLRDADSLRQAGEALLATGAKAVLLKGGHGGTLEGGETLTDLLFVAGQDPRAFVAERMDTPHTHGTGCTLSTAIACGLAQGLALADAVERAHAFVQRAIRAAPGLGAGFGPIDHLEARR